MHRLLRWLLWSVAVSVVPFLGLGILRFLDLRQFSGMEPLIGTGQLLLTSVAIVAGGVRELAGMRGDARHARKDFLFFASFVFAILLAMTYGYLANEMISGRLLGAPDQTLISQFSLVMFGLSVITAGAGVWVSSPKEIPNA